MRLTPCYIKNLLQNLTLEDKKQIMERSFYHSNHFYKIVLKIDERGNKLRLHYWKKKENFIQNPHNHGWSFESLLLRGSLMDVHYVETEDKDCNLYEKYSMNLKIVDERYHCSFSTLARLRMENIKVMKTGEKYSYHQDKIHTSHPLEDGTITVLLQTPQIRDENLIFKQILQCFETEKHHQNISLEILNSIIEEVLSSLVISKL